MAMRKILLTLISFVALAALVACGNSNNSNPVPTAPTGGNSVGFSNSNLAGTYVFSGNGVNRTGNNFALLGAFTANGSGNITSGYRNVYTDGSRAVLESVTGSYNVNQDGRGQVFLNGSSGQAIYQFVMQSPSSASFFQFSSGADATGRLQLQSTVVAPSGTYIVRLDGEDSSGNIYGAIGGIAISGTSITGTIDQNDNGILDNSTSAPLSASGTLVATDSNGRGTLQLSIAGATHNFVYYFVSPSHIELIGTDGYSLHGYADLQTSVSGSTAAFTGDQVFSLSGFNSNGAAVIETGRFTLGGGAVTNAVEDYQLGGNSSSSYFGAVTFTNGTYAASSNGRWTAQISGSQASNLVGWQVSPQQSVLLAWNASSTNAETGTLRAQNTTVTTASITGPYAANLSGFNYNDPGYVELAGNLDASGGSLNGTIDSQTPGYYNTNVAASGTYSIATDGTGRSPNGNIAGVAVVIYTVDANTAYLISSDNTRLYQGKMVSQLP
jgi:hypothetical protein